MREIIFKAQRVDGKGWVEGSLCMPTTENETTRIVSWNSVRFEVIPETVCQYTGLNDKNGTRIFEGDIIIFGDKKIKQVVEYRKGQYIARQINTKGSYIGLGYCDWEIYSEVIGNVHDKN
jgi:uncharacterized phage protein (TIGR01671 family)